VAEDAVDPVRLGGHRKAGSYLQAQFHRLRAGRGAKKAIGAVAASMLTAVYHMLKTGTFYQDLGADHFQRRFRLTSPSMAYIIMTAAMARNHAPSAPDRRPN
jgi:hypothetical protein